MRPFHVWWLGAALFAPALLVWITVLVAFGVRGWLELPFDAHGLRHIILPFFAAVLGFTVPLVCLRALRRTPARVWGSIFVAYLCVMLAWGIIDIRHENHQLVGHRDARLHGHKKYFHRYTTWYFLPYRWIEKGLEREP